MTRRDAADDASAAIDSDLGSPGPSPLDRDAAAQSAARVCRRTDPPVLAAIAIGGALGAPARYGVGQLVHVAPGTFPWGTFWTNISGSFALGLILALVLERFPPTRYLRPFMATGFLGAYTTYSTFAVEAVLMLKDGHAAIAVAYAASSLLAGFFVAWAGILAARAVPLPGRGGRP
jgi:fluoride exporter